LQLQVELTRLNDQSVQIEQRMDILHAQLGRWIGENEANRSLPHSLPHWPNPPSVNVLRARLLQHPLLKVDAANIEAARDEVAYAKEQYKPGWMLDVQYGLRQGHMTDGAKRSDMVTAQVTIDLPIFPGNRQNKKLCASVSQLEATRLDRDIEVRPRSWSKGIKSLNESNHIQYQPSFSACPIEIPQTD
jgi:outer membrane protein TolC